MKATAAAIAIITIMPLILRLATGNSTGSPLMTEGLGFESEDEPVGWVVLDPDGNVVDSGGQTVTEASAGAGEE